MISWKLEGGDSRLRVRHERRGNGLFVQEDDEGFAGDRVEGKLTSSLRRNMASVGVRIFSQDH